jgi:hypothetical protein
MSILPIKYCIDVRLPYAAARCRSEMFFRHWPQRGKYGTAGMWSRVRAVRRSRSLDVTDVIISSMLAFAFAGISLEKGDGIVRGH